MSDSVSSQNSNSFNLNLRLILQQTLHFHQNHRGKVFTQARAIAFANLFHARAILVSVSYINHQPCDLFRLAARFAHNGDDIGQRAIELFDKICADDLLLLIPRNLTRDEER